MEMIPVGWIAAGALAALVLGLVMILGGRGMRQRRGLGAGKTVALDNVTLTSRRYRLVARPDRLIREGNSVIPEEWKSAHRVWPSHRVQLGVTFLVIEDRLKLMPTHGFIVCGDGSRHRVENDAELRAWVLKLNGEMRAVKAHGGEPIEVNPRAGQCRPCGMLGHCRQARV
jgi:CRISPR-associated exonuclease Cas4